MISTDNIHNESPRKWTATPGAFVALVENIGLEPMTSCMPCKRSSQLS